MAFRGRPVHPGLNVGFDLILFLFFLGGALATIAGALTAYYDNDSYNPSSGGYDCSSYPDDETSYCQDNGDGSLTAASNTTTLALRVAVRHLTPLLETRQSTDPNGNPLFGNSSSITGGAGTSTTGGSDGTNGSNYGYYSSGVTTQSIVLFVVAGFAFLFMLFHFVLFVASCVDTARYNRRKQNRYVDDVVAKRMTERGGQDPTQQPFLNTTANIPTQQEYTAYTPHPVGRMRDDDETHAMDAAPTVSQQSSGGYYAPVAGAEQGYSAVQHAETPQTVYENPRYYDTATHEAGNEAIMHPAHRSVPGEAV